MGGGALIGMVVAFDALKENQRDGNSTFGTFNSCGAIAEYINDNREDYFYPYPEPFFFDDVAIQEDSATGVPQALNSRGSDGNESIEFSETNVQVEGVDESDIVKTDGSYVYYINDFEVQIIDMQDPVNPSTVAIIEFDDEPQELYVDGSTLAIQVQEFNFYGGIYRDSQLDLNATHVYLYDISNPTDPVFEKKVSAQGNYYNSRKIDNTLYIINTSSFYTEDEINVEQIERFLPRIAETTDENGRLESSPAAQCDEVSYFSDNVQNFITISAIDTSDTSVATSTRVILGDSSNVYMSRENLYLATVVQPDFGDEEPVFDDVINDDFITPREEPAVSTEIFRLSVDGSTIEFDATGMVPGTIKNQFSMDEYEGNLRIATTTNDWWGWNDDSRNNLYVLDESMNIVGDVEGLAKGERIYATRFIGDRAYVVTFRQIDPLYVFDLSDSANPTVLGELKIPGFSEYLHPYDENHIIGIGKQADENTGRTEGLKVALFNVTDPSNPEVLSEVIIGDAGSDSAVLSDHKAFLFDRERNTMVIPATIIEQPEEGEDFFYEYSPEFIGFIVFDIDTTDGIVERGRVSFDTEEYYFWSAYPRSLYIEDSLITLRDSMLKVNDFDTVEDISNLEL